jgi:Phosphotransferase system, mannose/fructose-specific component IIA
MRKILIASHGSLASGILSSLKLLLGSAENVTAIDAYMDSRDFKQQVEEYFLSIQPADEVIMLSDLYGGSVNQVLYLFLERENTRLVAGYNLALVLELALIAGDISDEDLIRIVTGGKEAIQIVSYEQKQIEEDFF